MHSLHREENEAMRREQVASFLSSGLSEQQWCGENSVSISTLRYWKRKIREESGVGATWVELNASATTSQALAIISAPQGGHITVRIGAFSVEVGSGSDPTALVNVLSVLASLC
jgi:hypothetical protein